MFFRGYQPETSIWRRFRAAADGFVFSAEDGYYAAHVVANAERVVDLFLVLMEHMPPAVDIVLRDERTGRAWKGESLALPDVRDALARLKMPLSAFGGVEVAVYTGEDQLTLNTVIELFIYARTDRWLYLLQGKGLEERRLVRTRSWKLKRQAFAPAPELAAAVERAAGALHLTAECSGPR